MFLFKVIEFQQNHYTENFIQCILDGGLGADKQGAVIVVGGDGRYLGTQVVSQIIKIAAANGVCYFYYILLILNYYIFFKGCKAYYRKRWFAKHTCSIKINSQKG